MTPFSTISYSFSFQTWNAVALITFALLRVMPCGRPMNHAQILVKLDCAGFSANDSPCACASLDIRKLYSSNAEL